MQRTIEISKIRQNPYQPRTNLDPEGIEQIAASIKKYGILQPLLVRDCGDGTYELIAGQRRIEGSKKAGMTEIPVIVKDVTDAEMLEMAIIENVHREDMSPIEKARGFRQLMTRFNLTQNQISNLLGISRPAIANTLRLLDLPDTIQNALYEKKITEGHARALLYIKNEKKREIALKRIVESNLSVRESERLSRKISKISLDKEKPVKEEFQNEEEREFINYMTERLGTKVRLVREKEGGRIEIEFYSDEHLQSIAEML